MKVIISLLVVVFFASCYTQHKAAEQMDKAHSRYEVIAAQRCANWYPIKIDSVQGETVYLPGQPIITPGETKFVNCDSIKKDPGNTNTSKVRVDCPPSQLRVDTVLKPYYITKENTAAKRELELELQQSKKTTETKTAVIIALAFLLACSIIGNIVQKKLNYKQ